VARHYCVYEDQVLAAMKAARWPDGCDAELRNHVETCAACTELVALAEALLDDQKALLSQAQIPSSAIVWWRAQMRSRREAAKVVTQPMTFVQGLILACAAGLMVAAIGFLGPTFQRAFAWFGGATEYVPRFSLSLSMAPGSLTNPVVIGAAAALLFCAIVLPLALYFTFEDEKSDELK
jgi:hypothetical protein